MAVSDAKYDEIGQAVIDIVPDGAQRVLLYVEFLDGVVFPFLHFELNSEVHHTFANSVLADELFRLQAIFGTDVKAMEFQLNGDEFSVQLTYADQFDAKMESASRADQILKKYFGPVLVHEPPF